MMIRQLEIGTMFHNTWFITRTSDHETRNSIIIMEDNLKTCTINSKYFFITFSKNV